MGFVVDYCADVVEKTNRQKNPMFGAVNGVHLAGGGQAVPARIVFTAEEMEERITRYRERAEKALPLFCTFDEKIKNGKNDIPFSPASGGDAEQEAKWQRQRQVTCHGCGLTDHRSRTIREPGWRWYPRQYYGQKTPARFFCPSCQDGPPPYPGAKLQTIKRPKYMITADRVLAHLREHGPTEEITLGKAVGIESKSIHDRLKSVNDCLISAGLVRVESQEKPTSRRRPDKNYTFPRLQRIWHLTEKGQQQAS